MQCPKCSYEPTMSEMQRSPHQCPNCSVFYAKVRKAATASIDPVAAPQCGNKVRFTDWLDSNSYARVVGALILGLVLGYFAGREHIKYEIKSALMGTAESISSAINSAMPFAGEKDVKAKSKAIPEKVYPIVVGLLSKDFYEQEYESSITIGLQFINRAAEPVRAFDGMVIFTDLLGNEILTSSVSISDPIAIGATLKWDGEIKYNKYMSSHRMFNSAEIQNIKATFRLQKVLFQDGKLEEF